MRWWVVVLVLVLLLGGGIAGAPLIRARFERGKRAGDVAPAGKDGIVPADPLALARSAGVSPEIYALARTIASEQPKSSRAVKVAVGWAVRNEAKVNAGGSVLRLVTRAGSSAKGAGRFGAQWLGRYAATSLDPYESEVEIAAGILGGSIPDSTGGARWFFNPKAQDAAYARGSASAVGARTTLTAAQVDARRLAGGLAHASPAGVDAREIVFYRKAVG